MNITREDILRAIDREISGENTGADNLTAAREELSALESRGPINGEWIIYTFRPVIGKFIVLVKRFLRKMLHGYIPRIVEEENQRSFSQNRTMNYLICAVDDIQKQLAGIQKRQAQLEALHSEWEESLRAVENMLTENRTAAKEGESRVMNALRAVQDGFEQELAATKDSQFQIREAFQSFEKDWSQELAAAKDSQLQIREAFQSFEKDWSQELAAVRKTIEAEAQQAEEEKRIMAQFPYDLFEDRFRGTTEAIQQRQSIYLPYFQDREWVLDCGCGRGEFLSLLRASGIRCKGIDISAEMVSRCQRLGLDAEQADIFSYLEQQADCSLEGVFCCQVIEHLTNEQLFRLVSLLNRKVRIGSPLVIETINPGTLPAGTNGFYMDFTHVRPVNSASLAFLLEVNGFSLQRTLYLHRDSENELPALTVPGAEAFNEKMQKVNDMLFGPWDYAIIAYRG